MMKKLLKRGMAALLTAAVCSTSVGLIGCGGGNDELIVWWPSGKAYIGIINDAVSRFKKENPNVKIKVMHKDIDAFDAYKFALNDDKTRPDVAIVDHVYVQALAQQNQLTNLSDNGTDDIKNLFPSALYNANTYNGNAYALPMSANTVVLMVNNDILKDCGIVDGQGNAKHPTTYEELIEDCEIIKSKNKVAFAQPLNSFAVMEFTSYVSRNGGAMVSEDGKKITFNNEGVVKALHNWKEMSKYANTNTYEEDKFYSGKVAFVEMGSWSLPNVTGSSARFDCGFSEMVTIDDSQANYSGLGLYSLCVARKTRDKATAVKFASFLATDSKVQLAFNKEKNLFPVTNETLADEFYTQNDAYKVFVSQLQKTTPRPATPVWPDMEQALINMLREVVTSNSDDFTSIINSYQKSVQQASDRLYK
ncbi:MAG: extracellular solute-binding protein [Clostridiales bacterium]|nr:extracellular solute-binding protein [Clostridiales bacterium]